MIRNSVVGRVRASRRAGDSPWRERLWRQKRCATARAGEHGSPGPIDNRSAGCQPAPQGFCVLFAAAATAQGPLQTGHEMMNGTAVLDSGVTLVCRRGPTRRPGRSRSAR